MTIGTLININMMSRGCKRIQRSRRIAFIQAFIKPLAVRKKAEDEEFRIDMGTNRLNFN
jgi:hypothetical protein